MTPANPDALADALALEIARIQFDGLELSRREYAERLLAGPLAPILADLQRVTAERDEARARADRIDAKLGELNAAVRECLPPVDVLVAEREAAEAALAAAEARAAQLQAEVEALKGALKPFAEAAEAYGHSHDESQINERPAWAGKDYVEARLLAKHLRAARAATAREGRSDG